MAWATGQPLIRDKSCQSPCFADCKRLWDLNSTRAGLQQIYVLRMKRIFNWNWFTHIFWIQKYILLSRCTTLSTCSKILFLKFLVIRSEIGKKFPSSLDSNEDVWFTIWCIPQARSLLLAKNTVQPVGIPTSVTKSWQKSVVLGSKCLKNSPPPLFILICNIMKH